MQFTYKILIVHKRASQEKIVNRNLIFSFTNFCPFDECPFLLAMVEDVGLR